MLTRTLSVLVLAPPFLAAIWFGFPYFDIAVGAMGLIAATELLLIICSGSSTILMGMTLISFAIGIIFCSLNEYSIAFTALILGGVIAILSTLKSLKKLPWAGFGYFYVMIAIISLIEMRKIPDIGRQSVFWFFFVIWANDIGAYFFGRTIGGIRIAPLISPGKTWAGTLGGVSCAAFVSLAYFESMILKQSIVAFVFWGILLAIGAQIGDLIESYFKRCHSVKDSGTLIPGHGGMLDRIDSVLLTAPTTLFVLLYFREGT